MGKTMFRIRLRDAHQRSGLSAYAVGKRTGIAQNTIRKYILQESVIAYHLEGQLIDLIGFYGEDWRDPAIIEVITDNET